jgi:ABC-type uncharacterized transport system ATPase subunit
VELDLRSDRTVTVASPDASFALSLRDIHKRFGSTVALDGAHLDVRAGTLHALLGENGAGKTTLMRLAFGMLQPDRGTIHLDGVPRRWRSSADALHAGVGMVHQHFLLVPAMTVAENIELGRGGAFGGFLGGFDPRVAADRVRSLAADTGLTIDPDAKAGDLPVGAQQRLEILKALSHDARVLILDEPTAVLSPHETRDLYQWLQRFVASGKTVVLITHKVREALELADHLTVLRRGRTVLEGTTHTLSERDVLAALLGDAPAVPRDSGGVVPSAARDERRAEVLALHEVTVTDEGGVERLRAATLAVRGGEILGVAGVEGAGQLELLRVLAGRCAASSGSVRTAERLGFVPEDRQRDAVIGEWSLIENFALKDAGHATGVMQWDAVGDLASQGVRAYDVRTPGVATPMGALSGGNQQKFVLARELSGDPQALIVENPTRGLDVRASEQVVAALRAARAAGVAVVVYSSDLDEILAIADRMAVCFAGRVREVAVDRDAVGRAMVGVA